MVIRVSYKKHRYLNNYLKILFCQAYCFNVFPSQKSFFCQAYCFFFSLISTTVLSKTVRLLASHVKFENFKALKKELNKELMFKVWHLRRW